MSSFDCRVVELLCFVNVSTLFVQLIGHIPFFFISESITSSGKNNNRKTNLEALNYARTALHHVYSRIIVWYIQPPAVGGGGDLTDTHYAIWHFLSYKCVWLKKFYGLHCYNASLSEHCGTLLVC